MLPNFLVGSYRRYKEDTDVFIRWLSKTAAACSPSSPATPLKQIPKALQINSTKVAGARRKVKVQSSKGSVPVTTTTPLKHAMSVKDLLQQAEIVAAAEKTVTKMPGSIQKAIERAIYARQRCALWFRKIGLEKDLSTEGHLHFINALEKALRMLCPISDGGLIKPAVKSTAESVGLPDSLSDHFTNRFELLSVEDTEDILEATGPQIGVGSANNKASQSKVRDVYELEVEPSNEYAFAVFCFFEDMHRVQNQLKQTWNLYKNGSCDLVTASMTTNAAIRLVRNAEEEVEGSKTAKLSSLHPYQDICVEIFFYDAVMRGMDVQKTLKSRDELQISPFDDFIYLPTFRILRKFQDVYSQVAQIEYPQPIPPVKMSYAQRPELLALPNIQKWEQEDQILTQYLLDLGLEGPMLTVLKERGHEPWISKLLDDEITSALKTARAGKISAWTVFAARLFLDIQEVVGDRSKYAYDQLLSTASTAIKTLDFKIIQGMVHPSGEGWMPKDSDVLMKLYNTITHWISPSAISKAKLGWLAEYPREEKWLVWDEAGPEMQERILKTLRVQGLPAIPDSSPEVCQKYRDLKLHGIKPAADGAFLYTHNPVYCGTMVFNLDIDLEQAGFGLANHHVSIFLAAHIYNALQQSKLIRRQWPEMEKMIHLHMRTIFAGKLPTTCKDFSSRCMVCLGFSTRTFARNQRSDSRDFIWGPGKKDGPQLGSQSTTVIFRKYFAGEETLERCLYLLESLMEESELSAAKGKKLGKQSRLTPLQFLTRMQEWLPGVLPDMRIDYISMTRTCNVFLRRVRDEIKQRFDFQYPPKPERRMNDYGLVHMTLGVLEDANISQKITEELLRLPGGFVIGPQLQVAGEVMEAFLGELADSSG